MSFLEGIFYVIWRGLAIGLLISAPMGPVGMLCIQRTLDKGRRAGFFTGVGASFSDFFYCILTGFGLTFIEDFLEKNSNIIQLVGSAVLFVFAVYLYRKNPTASLRKKQPDEQISIKKNILGGFLFTFSNPLILFLIIGLFARFNFLQPPAGMMTVVWYHYIFGYASIIGGALIWWWLVTFIVNKVRNHFNIRSMWVINKIIGVIIFLFALVGTITAIVGLTSSEAKAQTLCWNSSRGFEDFADNWNLFDAEGKGTLTNKGDEPIFIEKSLAGADEMTFRFNILNHNASKKDECNRWSLTALTRTGNRLEFKISSIETPFDGLSTSPALLIELLNNGKTLQREVISNSNLSLTSRLKAPAGAIDPTGRQNIYKLTISDGRLVFYGSNHNIIPIFNTDISEPVAAIGFKLYPGANVTIDDMRLTSRKDKSQPEFSPWNDLELLTDYLDNSKDNMEGYWQTLDRSLDEERLKTGGNYRCALTRAPYGYDLIYLDGASVNGSEWEAGMLKAKLEFSGIEGIYDVIWLDAMFDPISNDVRAQIDNEGALRIQFPYHNSSMRLVKTR